MFLGALPMSRVQTHLSERTIFLLQSFSVGVSSDQLISTSAHQSPSHFVQRVCIFVKESLKFLTNLVFKLTQLTEWSLKD